MILIAWLVFIISGLAQGLAADNAAAIDKMKVDRFLIQSDAEQKLNRSVITPKQWQNVSALVPKNAATPFGQKMLSVSKNGTAHKQDVALFAIDAASSLAPKVLEGKSLTNTTKGEVVVNQSLKEAGIQLGDFIQDFETDQKWKVVGFANGQSYSHAPVIFINLNDWNRLTKNLYYNAIALQVNQIDPSSITGKVKDVTIINKDQLLQNIPGFKEEQGSLTMMITFLFVIASFVQAVFFYVMTLQKTHQFGVLKAIGANTSYLARSLITQVGLLTIIAILCSLVFSYLTQMLLPSNIPFQLNIDTDIQFSALFLGVSLIGSLLSLYQIAKVDALEAIGRIE